MTYAGSHYVTFMSVKNWINYVSLHISNTSLKYQQLVLIEYYWILSGIPTPHSLVIISSNLLIISSLYILLLIVISKDLKDVVWKLFCI